MKPNDRSLKKSWAKKRYVLIGIVLLACLGISAVVLIFSHSPSRELLAQRIATVNAAHVLAPEENAATIYDQLVASGAFTGTGPDPILTGYTTLVKASRMESCWFPLVPGEQCYLEHGKLNLPMRRWMFELVSMARSDVAGERYANAAEKLDCLTRMAGHLQQQLLASDFLVGMAIENHVSLTLAECIMQANDAEELLRVVEAMPPDKLANDYEHISPQILQVSALIAESVWAEQTPQQRVRNWWQRIREKSEEENCEEVYLRLLSRRRGTRLLAGLKRYHDTNGRWPDSLDEIGTLVPEQALIDPLTEQTFVYRKEAGSQFVLYSKGPNKRDENGLRDAKADDYRIWPRYGIKAP